MTSRELLKTLPKGYRRMRVGESLEDKDFVCYHQNQWFNKAQYGEYWSISGVRLRRNSRALYFIKK